MALERLGWTVTVEARPLDLRRQLKRAAPRLLLMDLVLPGANGLDLLREFNAGGMLKDTSVFMLTSMAFPEVIQQAAEAGVKEVLLKPVDLDALAEKLKEVEA